MKRCRHEWVETMVETTGRNDGGQRLPVYRCAKCEKRVKCYTHGSEEEGSVYYHLVDLQYGDLPGDMPPVERVQYAVWRDWTDSLLHWRTMAAFLIGLSTLGITIGQMGLPPMIAGVVAGLTFAVLRRVFFWRIA